MFERLSIAKNLCSNNWILFISIDNNEIATLKMLCDEIFGEFNFIGTIDWESKTKSQNTKSVYQKLQPKCKYILCYGSKEYDLSDEKGCYREHCIEVMNAGGVHGRKTRIFDIGGGTNKTSLNLDYNRLDDVYDLEIDGKVIIKIKPTDERTEKTVPFWAFFDKTIGTAESGKKKNLIQYLDQVITLIQ